MKFKLIILMIFLHSVAYAQLTDNFTDGNFSLNPVWSGSSSNTDFTVVDTRLRSNSITANSNFYISTPNSLALNTTWEFWVNLQFSTSGNNYTDVYLISDKADLQNTSINGYFVRIGNTDDEISLYKRSGSLSSSVKIIDGINGSVGSSNNTIKIKVSRDNNGLFTLERDVVTTGSAFVTEGSATDISYLTSSYFGVYVQQSTASFFQKHFFDDFKIQAITDVITDTVITTYKAKFGDVIINEIFADPSPQIDLPSVEFIELLNTSKEIISLKNWQFADPGTVAILGDISLNPNSYLILCAKADTTEFKKFGKVLGISPWPSLNNSGDVLKLLGSENIPIDSVPYADSWYRNAAKKAGGWTLEKRDINSKCLGLFNWSASIDTSGGTPGRRNSIYLENYDLLDFKADSVKMTSDTTIKVYFNKHLNASDILVSNFNLSHASEIKKISSDIEFKEVSLLFGQKFAAATEFILRLTGIKDCSGSPLNISKTLSFKTAKGPVAIPERPDKGRVQITEIFADPSPEVGLPLSEFIEIYNPDADTVNLDLWTIKDPSSKSTIRNQFIAPKEYIILCAIADTTLYKPFGKTIGINPWPSLNNNSDQIVLKSFKNRMIDSIAYSDNWYKNEEKKKGGYSLEMIDPASLCNNIQNWNASKDASGGTPGKQNSVFDTGTAAIPLKLTEARLTDSVSLLLTFNKGIDSLSGSILQHFNLNNGVGEPSSVLPLAQNFDQVLLKFKEPPARGHNYTMLVKNITDCAGTLVAPEFNSASFILTEKIRKNDILISEILFNPRPDGVDFIEIYNNTNYALDLQELALATIQKDTLSSIKLLSTKQALLEPDQYLVLTSNPDNIKKEYQTKGNFLNMASLPAFNDDAGTAILLSQKIKIDQFNYTEKMHFQLLKNFEGVSLERSSFTKQANEMGNFRSATASSGYATPGYKNSQQSPDAETEDQLSLSSKTFSPDNDGFEDLLEINYHFDKPGLIANVNIYNDKGVLVKKLLKNFTLSAEGVFTWDGLNEFNSLPGMGLYILNAEIFDTDGNLKKFTRSFALAVKL